MTQAEFVANVRNFMDAESSARWSDPVILSVGSLTCDDEWSEILNQNRFYRVGTRSVTTDSEGRIALSDLDSGSGDTAEQFYRLLTGFTDGNILWSECDLDQVPLGTATNWQSPYTYLYYLAGDYFQLLPVQSGLSLTVQVNHTPTTVGELSSSSSTINYVRRKEWILVWVTAATLLLKGGAESQAAADLLALADSARTNMLGDIGRLTTRPTSARWTDSASAWGG